MSSLTITTSAHGSPMGISESPLHKTTKDQMLSSRLSELNAFSKTGSADDRRSLQEKAHSLLKDLESGSFFGSDCLVTDHTLLDKLKIIATKCSTAETYDPKLSKELTQTISRIETMINGRLRTSSLNSPRAPY